MADLSTDKHDARQANRSLLADKIKRDGLDAALATMTDEEFKEFKLFVVGALRGKLDNQASNPSSTASPERWKVAYSDDEIQFVLEAMEKPKACDQSVQNAAASIIRTLGAKYDEIAEAHQQCASDKNWLRAQRDTAEEKLASIPSSTERDLLRECRNRLSGLWEKSPGGAFTGLAVLIGKLDEALAKPVSATLTKGLCALCGDPAEPMRAEVIEECAKVCDVLAARGRQGETVAGRHAAGALDMAAYKIRALNASDDILNTDKP